MSAIIEGSKRSATALPSEAVSLIEAGQYKKVITLLEKQADGDDSGESHAALGLAYFHLEKYPRSKEFYETALERDGGRSEWVAMRDHASANASAKVHLAVPEVEHFDRDTLLAPPPVTDGDLPSPPRPIPRSTFQKILTGIGNLVGAGAALLTHAIVHAHGKLFGYRDEVWTNWYRRGQFRAILTLAYMRDLLNKNNLKNTYPMGELIGFQKRGQTPPEGVRHFRTADGSWNNLANPKEGAAGTRFPRNVEKHSIRPEVGERLLTPNPREVSRKLLTRKSDDKTVPFLNLLAASWIQFQNHDWVSHGENQGKPSILEIPLAEDDPIRRKYHQTKMFVGATQPDPTHREHGEQTPITYINEVTHWWDGSQIYGSDQQTQDRLRSQVDGKLIVDERVRPGAQRHLRSTEAEVSLLGRQSPVQRGAPRERGGHGEDPHRGVDAGGAAEPRCQQRFECQLVRSRHS
jgi:hypothetical protein